MTARYPADRNPMSHTPGPWRWRQTGDDWSIIGRPTWPCTHYGIKGEWEVARLDDLMGDQPAELEANARLIAAAPELLAALREAKGLADMAVMSDDGDGTPSDDQASLERLRATIDAAIVKALGEAK